MAEFLVSSDRITNPHHAYFTMHKATAITIPLEIKEFKIFCYIYFNKKIYAKTKFIHNPEQIIEYRTNFINLQLLHCSNTPALWK